MAKKKEILKEEGPKELSDREKLQAVIGDIESLMILASRMRILLERTRNHMLPVDLAKEIDLVLREAKEWD